MNNQYLELIDLKIKIDSKELEFFKILNVYTKPLDIKFNLKEGIPLIFLNKDIKEDEYTIQIKSEKIEIFYSNYAGKLYALFTLIQLIHY